VVVSTHVHARVREQAIDIRDAQNVGERALAFRPFDHGGGVVAAPSFRAKETKELPHSGKPPPDRRSRKAAAHEVGEIRSQVLGAGIGNAAPLCAKRCREIREIAAIGGQRVLGSSTLGGEHVQEKLDQHAIGGIALLGHGAIQGCLAKRSGGIQIVISRGFGSNQVASRNMAP